MLFKTLLNTILTRTVSVEISAEQVIVNYLPSSTIQSAAPHDYYVLHAYITVSPPTSHVLNSIRDTSETLQIPYLPPSASASAPASPFPFLTLGV